ncbi:MAG TPA: hypothetical protein VMY35_07045 [Phycisphaerae bacterium]|nr:hypothetical protein [Phycisphaerae bacterium]
MARDDRKSAAAAFSETGLRRPRRHRRLFIALAVLGALVLLVGLGPRILSIGVVKDLVLAWASGRSPVRLAAEDLRLTWFGEQEVRGLSVTGPDGERLARVGKVRLESRLVDLVLDRRRLGALTVEDAEVAPRLLVFPAAAPEAPPEEAPAEAPAEVRPSALPLPRSVRVRNLAIVTRAGTIRVSHADFVCGEAYDRLEARLELVAGSQSGTAEVEAHLTGLSQDWQGAGAVGTELRLRCDGIPLAPVWQAIARDPQAVEVGGILRGRADLERARTGELAVRTQWDGRDLSAAGDALAGDRPTLASATLVFNGRIAAQTLHVDDFRFDCPVATLTANGTFDLAALESGFTSDIGPPVTGEGEARLQAALAPLAAMFRHTLGLHEDLNVTAGNLDISLAAKSEAEGAGLQLAAAVKDLQGTRAGEPIALAPFAVSAEIEKDPDGLLVKNLHLTASFGSLEGRGRMDDFTLDATLDLARATDEVSRFVDLRGRSASGTARLHLETSGGFAEGISLVAGAEVEGLSLALGEERHFEEPHVTLTAAARATFDEQRRPDGLTITHLEGAWSAGTLKASGSALRQDGTWTVSAKAEGRGEVGPLARQVAGCLGRPTSDITGRWQLAADLSAAETLDLSLEARGQGLTVPVTETGGGEGKRTLTLEDTTLSANVSYEGGDRRVAAVRGLRLRAPGLEATAAGSLILPRQSGEDDLALAGEGNAKVDLAALSLLLRPFGLLAPGSHLAGSAALAAKATTAAGRTSAEGRLEAADLDLYFADSQTALHEAHLTAPFTASYEPKTKRFVFETKDLASQLVKGSARGAFQPAEGGTNLEAGADLEFDGERLQAVLGARMPERMTLGGVWRIVADVRGPMPNEAPSWNRRLADLAGDGDIGVGTLAFRGLSVTAGSVPWKLAAGKLVLGPASDRPAALTVNKGTVRLAGAVDLASEEPRYILSEPLQVAKDVHLTGELAEGMLAYVSPLLGQSVSPTGRLGLAVRSADLPLGPSLRQRASADAEFTIEEFRSQLKGPLALLAVWAGARETVEEQALGPYPILLSDGRFHLRDQKVSLHGGIELRVDGTVGLDGTMDTLVGVPLTESLLKKFGVSVKQRGVWTDRLVRVPLTGTVSHPKLDEKQLLKEILKTVGEALLTPEKGAEIIEDLLKDILKKPPREKPGEEAPAPEAESAPPGEKPGTAEQPPPTLKDLIDLFKRPREEPAEPAK